MPSRPTEPKHNRTYTHKRHTNPSTNKSRRPRPTPRRQRPTALFRTSKHQPLRSHRRLPLATTTRGHHHRNMGMGNSPETKLSNKPVCNHKHRLHPPRIYHLKSQRGRLT